MEAGIVATLARLGEEGALAPPAPEPIAILIQGAINEATMAIAHADEPIVAMTGLNESLLRLLQGLLVQGDGQQAAPGP